MASEREKTVNTFVRFVALKRTRVQQNCLCGHDESEKKVSTSASLCCTIHIVDFVGNVSWLLVLVAGWCHCVAMILLLRRDVCVCVMFALLQVLLFGISILLSASALFVRIHYPPPAFSSHSLPFLLFVVIVCDDPVARK